MTMVVSWNTKVLQKRRNKQTLHQAPIPRRTLPELHPVENTAIVEHGMIALCGDKVPAVIHDCGRGRVTFGILSRHGVDIVRGQLRKG